MQELKEFIQGLCDVVVEGYPSMTPYPNETGEHYITFGQLGIKVQYIDQEAQTTVDDAAFKESLEEYAQDKQRLIIRKWPIVQQDKQGKFLIRARLVGDDGTLELRHD